MKKMKVVLVEPGKEARVTEIDHTLESMQKIVGGYIERFQLDDEVCIICNDEGKLEGLPLNRAIFYEGELIEIIAGTFFICADPWDSETFESLTDEQIMEYTEMFKAPEYFVRTARGIAVVK